VSHQQSWWQWFADVLTPGTTPAATEHKLEMLDDVERNDDRRQQKLAEIERETQAIRRQLRAEADLMHRQWQ
jgi:hypothetical protein